MSRCGEARASTSAAAAEHARNYCKFRRAGMTEWLAEEIRGLLAAEASLLRGQEGLALKGGGACGLACHGVVVSRAHLGSK